MYNYSECNDCYCIDLLLLVLSYHWGCLSPMNLAITWTFVLTRKWWIHELERYHSYFLSFYHSLSFLPLLFPFLTPFSFPSIWPFPYLFCFSSFLPHHSFWTNPTIFPSSFHPLCHPFSLCILPSLYLPIFLPFLFFHYLFHNSPSFLIMCHCYRECLRLMVQREALFMDYQHQRHTSLKTIYR